MPDSAGEPQMPKAVWRRAIPVVADAVEEERPPRCGGDLPLEERYQLMKERRRKRKEAEAVERAREEAEAKVAARKAREKSGDDEDEAKTAERFRNDRYAVKLLQQDNSAWGGGGAGSGDVG
ncbi:hypothetical protein [Actinoplanes sp. NPDC051494]|uniref:hypothetical protein n=1 Tax=Actinoplanes sp. NPDC051494 TaxID=3363907 RepID=UPI0037AF7862